MPPLVGYLSEIGIEASLDYIANQYSYMCQIITLPEPSYEGRAIHAIRLTNSNSYKRCGILFIGGVHAREIITSDILISFALYLCEASKYNIAPKFGAKIYSLEEIQKILDSLEIWILPLVNPDGRAYVLSPAGDAMWRKNRRPSPVSDCVGVDVNRNFDFLWESNIGSSLKPCGETFKGTNAFSESETRNVGYLLDKNPNIIGMVDIHSFSELILYPWGDDDNQTDNQTMNFQNNFYDGMRGTLGDSRYREYIPQADLKWFANTGRRISSAIANLRGKLYTPKPGSGLYPTSGTSIDYAYSRHFRNGNRSKVFAFTLEVGTEFQPPFFDEGANIIKEISAGLIEFCLAVNERNTCKPPINSNPEPGATLYRDGRLVGFANGNDNTIWHRWHTTPNGQWIPYWESIGAPPGGLASGPVATLNQPGGLVVFVRGVDNAIWHCWQNQANGDWSGWESLDGQWQNTPGATLYRDGRLVGFALGTDNAIWHRWHVTPNGNWSSSWESIGAPPGGAISGPVATLNQPGGLVVFVRGVDNAIWHCWQNQANGDWSGWESLGGTFTSGPGATLYRDGRLVGFARGVDNAIWHCWQNQANGDWSGWESIGAPPGGAISGPVATLNQPGGLVVFVRGVDNAIWHCWQNQANGDWSGWESLGRI